MRDYRYKKIRIKGWGACFTDPAYVERVSYDVPTPSSLVGLIGSIYWKPEMRWLIDSITVYNKPKRCSWTKMEKLSKNAPKIGKPETLVSTNFIENVDYLVEAHIEMASPTNKDNCIKKHSYIFDGRIKSGGGWHDWPYFGMSDFPIDSAELIEGEPEKSTLRGEVDYWNIFHSFDYKTNKRYFYHCVMRDGVIKVPQIGSKEVFAVGEEAICK